jgi:hypothetical protein
MWQWYVERRLNKSALRLPDENQRSLLLMEFSYDSFRRLVQEVSANGYTCHRFDEPPGREATKRFYLRHDVDISPISALKLGQIEHELGVRGNFFFLLNSETYQLLSEHNIQIVRRLRELKHCVGLHIDQLLTGEDEHKILKTIEWFSEIVTPIDLVASFHRPTTTVLRRVYDGFINTYAPHLFSEQCYLSDSRRDDGFYPKLRQWMAEGKPMIQLLTHPDWWYPEPDIGKFMRDLCARREHELKRYLLVNFTKAFGEVLDHDENRTFGL